MNDIVDASLFLLRNRSVNGVNLIVDGRLDTPVTPCPPLGAADG